MKQGDIERFTKFYGRILATGRNSGFKTTSFKFSYGISKTALLSDNISTLIGTCFPSSSGKHLFSSYSTNGSVGSASYASGNGNPAASRNPAAAAIIAALSVQ